MIKAIIFDADGPLYFRTAEVTHQKAALLKKFGCNAAIEVFEATYNVEKFKGYVRAETTEEVFQNIFSTLGCRLSDEDVSRFAIEFDAIQRQVTPVDDAIATLKTLKEQDYKTCILTDSFYSSKEKRTWFKKLGMEPFIDHIISSYDIRKLKDTSEAYQACLDVLEIKADEAIFVGHQEYEMVGARKAGILSVAVLPISPPDISADYTIKSLSELPELLQQVS